MNLHGQRGTWQLTAFGMRVKKRLVDKNMTLGALAEKVGMSRSFLSQVLYGKKEGTEYIDAIKEALNIKDGNKKHRDRVG